nr:hypothetical protein [uncultured Desulfobulbus sp.]
MTRECHNTVCENVEENPAIFSEMNPLTAAPVLACSTCTSNAPQEETALEACLDAPKVLLNALKAGRLRGMVCMVGGEGASSAELDALQASLMRELLQRDILVLVSACTASRTAQAGVLEEDGFTFAGDGLAESCDCLDLSPVIKIGHCAESKRIIGFWTSLAQHAELTCADLPVALLSSTSQWGENTACTTFELTSFLEADTTLAAAKAANIIEAHIHNLRLRLSWCDRYHCTIHS